MTGTAAIWARRRRRRGCRAKKKEERRRRRREGERASSRDKNSCREGTTASKQARDDRKGVGKRRLELGETCYKGTVDSYIGAWQVTEPPPVGSHECEPCGGSCWYSPFAASTLCPYLHKLWGKMWHQSQLRHQRGQRVVGTIPLVLDIIPQVLGITLPELVTILLEWVTTHLVLAIILLEWDTMA